MSSAQEKLPDFTDPPWERQPGETDIAYAGFRAYRDLGEGRTIEKAVAVVLEAWPDIPQRDKRTKLSRASYKNRATHWSMTNRWVERAAAFDAHMDRFRLAAEEKGRAQMARHYEARVQHIKDMEWEIGSAAYESLKQLLSQPVLGEVRSQDGKNIHIHPNKEITKVLPALIREASRIIRLSQDLPTEGAKMPTPPVDTGPKSDVQEFFEHLGTGGEPAPSALLPDPEEPA